MRTLSNFLFNVLISDPAWILPREALRRSLNS
jgi:hypothetical protein